MGFNQNIRTFTADILISYENAAARLFIFIQLIGNVNQILFDNPRISINASEITEVKLLLRSSGRNIRIILIINSYRYHVFLIKQNTVRNISHKRQVSAKIPFNFSAVKIDFCLMHCRLKFYVQLFPLKGIIKYETLSVPRVSLIIKSAADVYRL